MRTQSYFFFKTCWSIFFSIYFFIFAPGRSRIYMLWEIFVDYRSLQQDDGRGRRMERRRKDKISWKKAYKEESERELRDKQRPGCYWPFDQKKCLAKVFFFCLFPFQLGRKMGQSAERRKKSFGRKKEREFKMLLQADQLVKNNSKKGKTKVSSL